MTSENSRAFSKQLPNDAPTSGADGGADGDLAGPVGGAGQEQVGDVSAGNQQNAGDRAQQDVKRGAHISHHQLLRRLNGEAALRRDGVREGAPEFNSGERHGGLGGIEQNIRSEAGGHAMAKTMLKMIRFPAWKVTGITWERSEGVHWNIRGSQRTMIGRKISHYQVIEKLGAGGMGEIWKAQDTRLNRMVAIKVLTNASAGDSERRRRFIQEAQAASALNHPNIITIHDIISDDGIRIHGDGVRGREDADRPDLPGGVGVAKMLQYSVQMADALRAAHAAGIIHRDLKPGNVMVTESGLVKILDFGLAKISVATKLTEETQTMGAAPMTVEGSILGTVTYMSPEQAQGKAVDSRSDIFSFGVVLYEMVTGAKAFAGDSAISTLSAILRDDVKPIGELVPGVPAEVVEIIGLALRKDPKDRWQSMQVIHTVLAAQKQKFDSGVFRNSGRRHRGHAARCAFDHRNGHAGSRSAAERPTRKPCKKWVWIAIGLAFVVWGKSCGSSRDRTKFETNIPGVSVSIPGVTDSPAASAEEGQHAHQSGHARHAGGRGAGKGDCDAHSRVEDQVHAHHRRDHQTDQGRGDAGHDGSDAQSRPRRSRRSARPVPAPAAPESAPK